MGNTVLQPTQNTRSNNSEGDDDDINEYDEVEGVGDDFQGFVGDDGDEGDDRYNNTGDGAYFGGLGQRKQVYAHVRHNREEIAADAEDDKSVHTFTSMREVTVQHDKVNPVHSTHGVIGGQLKSQGKWQPRVSTAESTTAYHPLAFQARQIIPSTHQKNFQMNQKFHQKTPFQHPSSNSHLSDPMHFENLIQSNQQHSKQYAQNKPGTLGQRPQMTQSPYKFNNRALQKPNPRPLKVSSKNYIPIQNFFATDQESKEMKKDYHQELCDQTAELDQQVPFQSPMLQIYHQSYQDQNQQQSHGKSESPQKGLKNQHGGTQLTDQKPLKKKTIQVFVEANIEFQIEISDAQYTCGWLQSEVVRKYYEVLEKQAYEQQYVMQQTSKEAKSSESSSYNLKFIHDFRRNTREQRMSTINQHVKMKKKFIVALKTPDRRESLDFWLTQYNRPLDCALEDGDYLRAHFAKLTFTEAAQTEFKVSRHDFEQIKVIGRGAFSRVILVRKKDTGRLYAMKIMRKDKLSREQKIKPIINERKIMEKLNHPFIIKLYWSFQSKTELFFVMDLCTGGEMFFHLGKVQKFTEEQARFYFAELLLGLEYLHDMDIVYRDIKPENILIDVDGHLKIADFGLSKIIGKRERSHSFCGSPEYMCPEILMGQGHDRRADIYCIGALLYELVVGFPPHFNQDHNEIYKGIVNNEPEYREHNLSNVLESLLKKLLQKDPNGRFQSIQEVKRHPWLGTVDWDRVQAKAEKPPIVPGPHSCCIDEEFLSLPLDFEDSSIPVLTERRQSCYYESTLMLKSIISDRNTLKNSHLQQLYNNLNDTKIVSLLSEKAEAAKNANPDPTKGEDTAPDKQGGEDARQPKQTEYTQSSQRQPQDYNNDQSTPLTPKADDEQPTAQSQPHEPGADDGNIEIEGLENFSFIDVPLEELELRQHFNRFIEQMRLNEIQIEGKEKKKPVGRKSKHEDPTQNDTNLTDQVPTDAVVDIADSMNITNSIPIESNDPHERQRIDFYHQSTLDARKFDDQILDEVDDELRQFDSIEQRLQGQNDCPGASEMGKQRGGMKKPSDVPGPGLGSGPGLKTKQGVGQDPLLSGRRGPYAGNFAVNSSKLQPHMGHRPEGQRSTKQHAGSKGEDQSGSKTQRGQLAQLQLQKEQMLRNKQQEMGQTQPAGEKPRPIGFSSVELDKRNLMGHTYNFSGGNKHGVGSGSKGSFDGSGPGGHLGVNSSLNRCTDEGSAETGDQNRQINRTIQGPPKQSHLKSLPNSFVKFSKLQSRGVGMQQNSASLLTPEQQQQIQSQAASAKASQRPKGSGKPTKLGGASITTPSSSAGTPGQRMNIRPAQKGKVAHGALRDGKDIRPELSASGNPRAEHRMPQPFPGVATQRMHQFGLKKAIGQANQQRKGQGSSVQRVEYCGLDSPNTAMYATTQRSRDTDERGQPRMPVSNTIHASTIANQANNSSNQYKKASQTGAYLKHKS